MVTDAIGNSADTFTLLETVAGKPSLDVERKIRAQPEGKITGKVEDGKENDPEFGPKKKVMICGDFNSRYQIALKSMVKQGLILGS